MGLSNRIRHFLTAISRNQIIRGFGDCVAVGKDIRLRGRPLVRTVQESGIEIGDGVVLNSLQEGYHAEMNHPVILVADRKGARIRIGAGSRLHGCFIHAWTGVDIGRDCLIAAGAQILDANAHTADLRLARLRTKIQDTPESITIGDFCWIGTGALILKGAKIGDGCIVAARSTVLRGEYPPFSLIGGSPASVIRTISSEEVLPEDYPLDQISANGMKVYEY